jgi:hypothetical protein
MSVKRPWDDLPSRYRNVDDEPMTPKTPEPVEARGLQADMRNIGRHMLFGVTIGGLTGAGISSIELMRDPRAMSQGQRGVATKRIGRFAGQFAGFFAFFHGFRKSLQLYLPPTSPDKQVDFLQISAIAAATTLVPVVALPKLRYMFPYAVFLIAMDGVNSYTTGTTF